MFESNCAGDKRSWKRKVFFANSKLKNQSFLDPFLKLTCPPSTTSTAKHAGISAWLLRGLVTLSHWQHWLSPVSWLSNPCFTCVKLQHQSHPELASRLLAQPKLDSVLALAGTAVPSRNTSQKSLKCRLRRRSMYIFLGSDQGIPSIKAATSKNHRNILLLIPSIPSSGPSICCNGSAGGEKSDGAVSCDAVSWGVRAAS